VIISGKGGTGKTSVAAAFASLATNAVFADCDVDAADLHLILDPEIKSRTDFISGHEAVIQQDECIQCGDCLYHCRYDAVIKDVDSDGNETFTIDPVSCEGCGVCVHFCPVKAIDFPDSHCGEWYISDTRFGPVVHAQLGIAAENSGKLVSLVRQEARKQAEAQDRSLILIDGPPGIGCPVIASITGATVLLIITEPTLSGEHDLERVLELARHFEIPALVCINKWDINPELTDRIEKQALELGAKVAGRIPYDKSVTAAQVNGQTVIEFSDSEAAKSIIKLWERVSSEISE